MKIFKDGEWFFKALVLIVRLGMAGIVFRFWKSGDQAYAIGILTFFVLDAIAELRDRINEIYWDRKR